MIHALVASWLLAATQPWTPAAIYRVQQAIDAALHAPTLAGAHVGLLAVDAATGAVLYARDADDAFVPASTFKLLTGSTALARLGPAYAFVTDVDADGSIDGGRLQGDLYLRGGGDAQLAPADLDAAAAAVAAAGVRSVSGTLAGDATRFDAPHFVPGWAIDDVPYEYAAIPSALSFDGNVAHVRVSPGLAVGGPAELHVEPASNAFRIENATVTGAASSEDTTDVVRPWNAPSTIRIVGSYPAGAALSDDLEPAVPDPAAYALDAFRRSLERHGVEVDGADRQGAAPGGATVLWSHRSKPLPAILADCWLPSDNLLAEQMLEALGAASPLHAGGLGDTRSLGIRTEREWLASIGVDPGTLTIVDGSGLSAYDRITPRALVAILDADRRGPMRDEVRAGLPIAGVRGTLHDTFAGTPLQGALWAKTGTTNHARLLAGYLESPSHGTVIVAFMVNDWMDATPQAASALNAARAAALVPLLDLPPAAP